ncbi:hypothetical protein HYU94_03150 [Candidatus Daviesbacteria bacterium]|nr:hypothetical protein [Candidatus Daviesbacteria bacterium]
MIARLLICPDVAKIKEEIALHLEGVKLNHPDVLYFKVGEKLGIAEARKIKEHFSLKPYSAKGRSVIIEDASVMTVEAQNALLKTIEELPKEAILIFGTPSDANFLPTILSRCEIIRIKDDELRIKEGKEDVEKLLEATIEQRFEYVEKLKNREEFLQALVWYFHQHLLEYPKFTKELLQAEKLAKQNVNIRAILEYLMLVMPMPK